MCAELCRNFVSHRPAIAALVFISCFGSVTYLVLRFAPPLRHNFYNASQLHQHATYSAAERRTAASAANALNFTDELSRTGKGSPPGDKRNASSEVDRITNRIVRAVFTLRIYFTL